MYTQSYINARVKNDGNYLKIEVRHVEYFGDDLQQVCLQQVVVVQRFTLGLQQI